MKEYLITAAVTWIVKTAIDYGVKKSKSTENTIDDFIFRSLQNFTKSLNPLKRFKK